MFISCLQMRDNLPRIGTLVLLCWTCVLPAVTLARDAYSDDKVQRARNELEQVKLLVEQGTLSKNRLAEAQEHLADAEDEAVLSQTLYGISSLQDMTSAQANDMLQAATRRVERQQAIVDDRRTLLDAGILARADFDRLSDELKSRQRVLELCKNRRKLFEELEQMVEAEQQLESARKAELESGSAMIRFPGQGSFNPNQFPAISTAFEHQFHHPLPVSAMGQTLLHRAMRLDHHGRIDVALNPDTPEGLWLRHLLESRQIPYLAFRTAVVGAATAPHIHIGPGSTRLALANP
jgi:hypothetical protein